MKKSEIFSRVLGVVSSLTDITDVQMLSMCRTEDVLFARALAVYYCRKCGLSNNDIRSLFGRKGHHFAQRMCDLCADRKQVNRYYSTLFAATCTQLGLIR